MRTDTNYHHAAFFATREVQKQKKLAKETSNDRQTRLDRERKPPTKSAEVFLWQWSSDGAIELVRSRVSKKEREDVLGARSELQCKYDAVFNTWDVCEYFGPDDPDGDDDDDDYGGGGDIGTDSDDMDVDDRPNINLTLSKRSSTIGLINLIRKTLSRNLLRLVGN
jgi:hypothetical protein